PSGFYNYVSNKGSRLVPLGGICEDAMGAVMTGVAAYGHHLGVTSSYAAFISALEHIPARLHAIGQQNRQHATGKPFNTFVMINAHAGVKTGEDGPTHADPQALQLLQGNFPRGTLITLTPWEPGEIWPLAIHSLRLRPAVLAPFVTRPPENVPDRAALGLPPAEVAIKGLYPLAKADPAKPSDGTVVLQGNGVAMIFVLEVLPELKKRGLNLNAFYVASAELFDLLPEAEKDALYPAELAQQAMGITDFTLPTMYPWIKSYEGIRRTMHPFKGGSFLGSGPANQVLEEAGVNAQGQLREILAYIAARKEKADCWR
ncbi:MAG: hypothetical protein PHP45_10320, partial [Elusimicrobiales bacterium]|nr:hypothetical protein [Elusimicrobiales bacterium]